jgi:UDP-N-acetylglucosamine 2-epimerase (non-hydrolysing)
MRRYMVNNLILVVGARPNFMKLYPLCKELDTQYINYTIFNTGQHYSSELNEVFEKQFNLERVHKLDNTIQYNKIRRIQDIRSEFTKYLNECANVGGVVVVGDVDSSYACALATANTGIPLVHIEAGLRSFDYDMHEELNRIMIA